MNEKLFDLFESKKEKYLKFLTDLVSIDSSVIDMGQSGNELEAQNMISRKFEQMGAEVDAFEINYEEIKDYKEANPEHDYTDRPNVVGIFRGTGGGKSLVINGHIDTVPFNNLDEWYSHPLKPVIRDGKLYGRGTCDMKAGLAAAIMAIETIKEAGIELKGDIFVQSVVDEEGGGNGTLACCARGYIADAGIIPEPTQLKMAPANMGFLMYKIVFRGKGIHCGIKWEGVSAIEKCMKFMQTMQELERNWAITKRHPYLPAPTINFSKINAGTGSSEVANECVLDMTIHFLPSDVKGDWIVSEIEKEFMRAVENFINSDDWLKDNRPEVDLFQYGSAYDIGLEEPICKTVESSYEKVYGKKPEVWGLESGADARLLTNYFNVPTLLFGPGYIGNAHSINEFVEIQDYYDAIKILALSIIDWCNSPKDING